MDDGVTADDVGSARSALDRAVRFLYYRPDSVSEKEIVVLLGMISRDATKPLPPQKLDTGRG